MTPNHDAPAAPPLRHRERSAAIQGQGTPHAYSVVVQGMKQPAVYIMASARNATIYVGVTSDLAQRVWQHRTTHADGFTTSHDCKLLVYYELHADMPTAITREKQLKSGSRRRKLALIESQNPFWHDLYDSIL